MQELVGPNTLQKIFNNDPQQFDQQQTRFNDNQMTMNGDMDDNTIQDNNNNNIIGNNMNGNNMNGNTMNGGNNNNNMNRFPQFSTTTRRMPFNGQNGQNGGGGIDQTNLFNQNQFITNTGPMVQQGGPNSSKNSLSLSLSLCF